MLPFGRFYSRSNRRIEWKGVDCTTSGVLLFANNYEANLEFKTTLKQGEWSKECVCKVDGVFPDKEQICGQPIGPPVVSMGIQCVRPDGKEAKSRFRYKNSSPTAPTQLSKCTSKPVEPIKFVWILSFWAIQSSVINFTIRLSGEPKKKGKNAEYEKSFEELCKDVRNTHKSENWHEESNLEFEQKWSISPWILQ